MSPLDRFSELSSWLAGTDIALLELRGPDTLIRLQRDGFRSLGETRDERSHADPGLHPGYEGGVEPGHSDSSSATQGPAVTAVRAPCVGIVRLRHPLHESPLAAAGDHVVAGQVVALLQIGHTLVPALAPRDGVVARVVASDGDAIGYGDPVVEILD